MSPSDRYPANAWSNLSSMFRPAQVILLPDEDDPRVAGVRQIIRVSADRLPNPIGVRVALLTLDTVGLSQPKQRRFGLACYGHGR